MWQALLYFFSPLYENRWLPPCPLLLRQSWPQLQYQMFFDENSVKYAIQKLLKKKLFCPPPPTSTPKTNFSQTFWLVKKISQKCIRPILQFLTFFFSSKKVINCLCYFCFFSKKNYMLLWLTLSHTLELDVYMFVCFFCFSFSFFLSSMKTLNKKKNEMWKKYVNTTFSVVSTFKKQSLALLFFFSPIFRK